MPSLSRIMKLPLRLACIAAGAILAPVHAQWGGTPPGPVWYDSNVGIGTHNPQAKLEVNGATIFGAGAQVAMPPGQSFLTGYAASADIPGLVLYNAGAGAGASVALDFYNTPYHCAKPQAKIKAVDDGAYSDNLLFILKVPGAACDDPAERMRITSAGNVGIGTATPSHLLQVAGTIGAQEVIVSSTGADYVFSPEYHLQPLNEVRQYIDQHHHLPDIPSAEEVKAKGLGVGEMQAKLLAKIEELTLHMIQAEERNRRLEQEIAELKKRLDR